MPKRPMTYEQLTAKVAKGLYKADRQPLMMWDGSDMSTVNMVPYTLTDAMEAAQETWHLMERNQWRGYIG